MCLRFVFLLITRTASWLRLSPREETWKTAEILLLRHQLAVLQRRQPRRPHLTWAVRAENPVHSSDQQVCSPGARPVMIIDHVPAVRVPSCHAASRWQRLSRREETWRSAGLLNLRHRSTLSKQLKVKPPREDLA